MIHALKSAEGIATVVIAVYVASIGTFQWITAREKLRLDLYNRRFEVYLRALDFMQALMMWSSVPAEERQTKRIAFIRATRESRFLFADDPRILNLLGEFHTHTSEMAEDVGHLGQPGYTFPEAWKQKQFNSDSIAKTVDRLEILLMPYLSFRHRSFRGFAGIATRQASRKSP